jgi:PAS domain S-box-containing protein
MASHPEPPGRFAVASGAGVLVYTAWVLLHIGGDVTTGIVDGLGLALACGGAAVFTVVRARAERGRARLGWGFLSALCATFLLGEAVTAYLTIRGIPAQFPSVADAGFVAGAVAAAVAVLLLSEWTWTGRRAARLLDGGIVAGAVFLLSWLTVLQAAYQTGHGGLLAFSAELAYAIADGVTMVVVVSALSHARRVHRALLMVGLAMLCFAVSDSVFIYVESGSTFQGASPLDAGWMAGYVLIAIASRVRGQWGAMRHEDEVSPWQLLLPYVPLVLSVVVVLVDILGGRPLDAFSEALLGVVVALVLLRQLLALVEAQSLAATLRTTSAEQRILIEQAPVGICRLDELGRIESANGTFEAMVGYPQSTLRGRSLLDLVHPADRGVWTRAASAGHDGDDSAPAIEARAVRADGSALWCSITVGPLEGSGGRAERSVAIIEDISQRQLQTERAAHVQRLLLPEAPPELAGYDVAGACRPAADVAGDFYDWLLSDGHLDVTVADVMGKGMASALVMAVLRTALRSAPARYGPAARVRLAADSLGLGMTGEGLFVTLFHARLSLATGRLRYVDAGHGYCAVRRPDGGLVRLSQRSLPIGVLPDTAFEEGVIVIEPGDQLVVFSDGLVEHDDRTLDLSEFAREFERSNSVSELVGRLMDRTPARPADDVTVLVLARHPGVAVRGSSAGDHFTARSKLATLDP